MSAQSAPPTEGPDFRLLFESSPDLYLVFTPELVIVGVSNTYLLAIGMNREQMLGHNIRELLPDFPDHLISPLPHGGSEKRHWRTSDSPILDLNNKVAYIIHRREDVTELFHLEQARMEQKKTNELLLERVTHLGAAQQRTEEELVLSRKLEGVGQMAGDTAHQLNNLLGVISGYSSMLLKRADPGSPLRGCLEEMRAAGDRAAALTQKLLNASQDVPPPAQTQSLPELQRRFKQILVVDDMGAMREVIRRMLEESGFEVKTAENGREARMKASEHSFDLVIIDLAMPEEDGFEAMSALRARYPELKIIAVTGGFGPAILEAAKVLGANATLMKPFTNTMLLDTMQGLLKTQQAG